MRILFKYLLLAYFFVITCVIQHCYATPKIAKLVVATTSFKPQGKLPDTYTPQNLDRSPQLSWKNAPAKTKSFVIICNDTSAQKQPWTHWLVFDIPKEYTMMPEGVPELLTIGNQAKHGENSYGKIGYDGPVATSRKQHKIVFTVYALNKMLGLSAGLGTTQAKIERAMKNAIIAQGSITALYP